MTGPKAFVVEEPNPASVPFGGAFVAVSDLARAQGLSISHVSRVLSGQRNATIGVVVTLAAALAMSLDDFMAAVEERRAELLSSQNTSIKNVTNALKNEQRRRNRARKSGRVFVPNAALGRVS